jgi:hypothetical protein
MHHWSTSGSAEINVLPGKRQPAHFEDMAAVAANLGVGELGRLFELKLHMVIMRSFPPGNASTDWADIYRS